MSNIDKIYSEAKGNKTELNPQDLKNYLETASTKEFYAKFAPNLKLNEKNDKKEIKEAKIAIHTAGLQVYQGEKNEICKQRKYKSNQEFVNAVAKKTETLSKGTVNVLMLMCAIDGWVPKDTKGKPLPGRESGKLWLDDIQAYCQQLNLLDDVIIRSDKPIDSDKDADSKASTLASTLGIEYRADTNTFMYKNTPKTRDGNETADILNKWKADVNAKSETLKSQIESKVNANAMTLATKVGVLYDAVSNNFLYKTEKTLRIAQTENDLRKRKDGIDNTAKQNIVKKAEERVSTITNTVKDAISTLDEGKLRPGEIEKQFNSQDIKDYPAVAQGILGTTSLNQTINLLYDFGKNQFKDVSKTDLKTKNGKEIKLSNNADKKIAALLVAAVALSNKDILASKGKFLRKLNDKQISIIEDKENMISLYNSTTKQTDTYVFANGNRAENPFKVLNDAELFAQISKTQTEISKTQTETPKQMNEIKTELNSQILLGLDQVSTKDEAQKYFGEKGSDADPKYKANFNRMYQFIKDYFTTYNTLPNGTKNSAQFDQISKVLVKLANLAYTDVKELKGVTDDNGRLNGHGEPITTSKGEVGKNKLIFSKISASDKYHMVDFSISPEKPGDTLYKEFTTKLAETKGKINDMKYLESLKSMIESKDLTSTQKEDMTNIYLTGLLLNENGNTENGEFGVSLTDSTTGMIKGIKQGENSLQYDMNAKSKLIAENLPTDQIITIKNTPFSKGLKVKITIDNSTNSNITKLEIAQ